MVEEKNVTTEIATQMILIDTLCLRAYIQIP